VGNAFVMGLIDIVAVNDVGDLKMMTHLLKYDTTMADSLARLNPGSWAF
jgi:hypothetical protein